MLSKPLAAMVLLGALVCSCKKDDRACEQMRRENAAAWGEVRVNAIRHKTATDSPDLPANEREQRLAAWGKVAQRAEALQRSFASRDVKWQAAEAAQVELNKSLAVVGSEPELKPFTQVVTRANQLSGRYEARCR